eukprot:TRINITY_DN102158_c0_g1_i1.p1 TRINITY_DN102158_c0_g1~~TRINITY_DN102158_c0_g1_i1.p1  ORF type:complete len:177 (+),score=35.65 TRINITY_DN102158_c0_g1_i1:52-531(+)
MSMLASSSGSSQRQLRRKRVLGLAILAFAAVVFYPSDPDSADLMFVSPATSVSASRHRLPMAASSSQEEAANSESTKILTPEEERQKLAAERQAKFKADLEKGDLGAIGADLGIPPWAAVALEVFIFFGEAALVYFVARFLPAEWFSWLPDDARTFLQL